jgi:DNA topoisomerase II
MGGKDAASARYIFTKLEPIARAVFHPDDDALLNYLNDDGSSIEPEYYVPVIPMILVNGADGIGTGWSSAICNFDPRQIVANIRRKIASEDTVPMDPFYCGFIGDIKKEGTGKYTVHGKIERVDDTTLLVSELPLKKWTQNYKEFLESLMTGDAKKTIEVKDFKENHTETTVSFTITAEKQMIDACEKDPKGLHGMFKLQASLSTTNMTLFDADGRIKRYDNPEAILDAFYDVRLDFYDKRKQNLMKILAAEKLMLSNKARFVEEVCQGTLVVSNRRRKDLLEDLKERKYDLISKTSEDHNVQGPDNNDVAENEDDEASTAELAKGYEYLLGMRIWSLTFEKAEQLRKELAEKTDELESLAKKQPSQLWLDDLDAIEATLDARDIVIQGEKEDELRAQTKNTKRVDAGKAKGKKKVAKKKKGWDSDMEGESSDEDNDFMDIQVKPKNTQDTKKKPAVFKEPIKAKPVPIKKAAPKADPIALDESSDEDFSVPLAERMKKNLQIAPSASFDSKKRSSPRSDDTSEDELDFPDLTETLSRSTKPPVAKKVARQASAKPSVKPKAKAAAKPALKPKAKAAEKKKQVPNSDSEVELMDNVSDESMKQDDAPKPKRIGRTTSKPVQYILSSDDDDGDESD